MILLILIISFISFLIYHFYLKRRHLPPGPTPYPLLGNTLTLKKYEPGYEAYKMWAKQYGPVYTLWMGVQPMVVITDYEVLKKTLVKDGNKFAGRAPNPLNLKMRGGDYGVIHTSDETWNQQRRFALHVLRDFGLGKNLMEERIISEVRHLMSAIGKECKKGPVDLQDHIDAAVGSVINNLLFGYRYDESNMAEFLVVKTQLARMMAAFGEPPVALLLMFPWLGKLPYFSHYDYLFVGIQEELFTMYRQQIAQHRKEIDFDSEQSTDYCEAFLKEQKKNESKPDQGGFSDMQLVNMCNDLWTAGMETTSNTLYWGVLYVLRAPEILKKIQEELDTVIGEDRNILSSDRPELHYTNAVVHEVQRMANLVPFNIPHRVLEEVEIEGFRIPKNTVILPQLCTVLYDEKIFPDPYRFDPNRHLDEKGHFVKIEELISFSLGKRACLGEGLARAELFLFLANIFYFFDLKPVDENNLPTVEKSMGATMKAKNYKLHLTPRRYKIDLE